MVTECWLGRQCGCRKQPGGWTRVCVQSMRAARRKRALRRLHHWGGILPPRSSISQHDVTFSFFLPWLGNVGNWRESSLQMSRSVYRGLTALADHSSVFFSRHRNNRTRLSDTGYSWSPQWRPQLYRGESPRDASERPETWASQHTAAADHRQPWPRQTGETPSPHFQVTPFFTSSL